MKPKTYESLDFRLHSVNGSIKTFGIDESVGSESLFQSPLAKDPPSTRIRKLSLDNYVEFTAARQKRRNKLRKTFAKWLLILMFVIGFGAVVGFVLLVESDETNPEEDLVGNDPEVTPPVEITIEPSVSPSIGPTLGPIPSLTPGILPAFTFSSSNVIEKLCGPNMDPNSAINGIFFAACAEEDAILCKQDTKDETLGELVKENCDGSCGCQDLVLLSPLGLEEIEDADEFCFQDQAVEQCPEPLEFISFIGNNISLTGQSILTTMEAACEEDDDAQVCLHSELKIKCKSNDSDVEIEANQCSSSSRPCQCTVNEINFQRSNICTSEENLPERCSSEESKLKKSKLKS